MRVVKLVGVVTPVVIGLCLMVGVVGASAVATGVCHEVPNEMTKECIPGTEYLENETFKGTNLGNTVIEDRLGNKISCGKSQLEIKLGKNPSIGAVSTKIEKLTWEECKLGNGEVCAVSKSPAPGDKPFPWASPLQWSTFGATGPNGTQKLETWSAQFKCGTKECSYVGAGEETSITAKFYNANDTNKPKATTRAELSFNPVALTPAAPCSGTIELTAFYALTPEVVEDQIYIANG